MLLGGNRGPNAVELVLQALGSARCSSPTVGSGGGFDTFIAADQVRPEGRVIGVDMTEEMFTKATRAVAELGHHHVEMREGYAEDLPVEDGWAD